MDKNLLKKALLWAWSSETTQGKWDPLNPSLGQCAVTAVVVQDYFGGELLRCKMTNDGSHYWNRMPDGTMEDFTEEQFDSIEIKPLKDDFVVREREYVLSFPATAARYEILKQRVENALRQMTL